MKKDGGGSNAAQSESEASKAQAAIANDLYAKTANLRQGLIGTTENTLGFGTPTPGSEIPGGSTALTSGGGVPFFVDANGYLTSSPTAPIDPNTGQPGAANQPYSGTGPAVGALPGTTSPGGTPLFGPYAPEREALQQGFGTARENIIRNAPARGGQLARSLIDLETNRAQAQGNLQMQGTQKALDIANTAAFGTPSTSISGLGQAAAGFGAAANRNVAQETATGQGIGQLIGTALLAYAKTMCWVADAIYGENTVDALLAREWVSYLWQGKIANVTRFIYRRIGPSLAWLIRRFPFLRSIFKPLFDIAVRRAETWAS